MKSVLTAHTLRTLLTGKAPHRAAAHGIGSWRWTMSAIPTTRRYRGECRC